MVDLWIFNLTEATTSQTWQLFVVNLLCFRFDFNLLGRLVRTTHPVHTAPLHIGLETITHTHSQSDDRQ